MALGAIAQVAAGPIASALNKLLADNPQVWAIKNLEADDEPVIGQFAPQNLTENVSSSFAEHTALSRKHPIIQYTHGNADAISFDAFFFAIHEGPPSSLTGIVSAAATFSVESFVSEDDKGPEEKIARLKEWAKEDDTLGRPPHVAFEHGDGNISIPRAYLSLGPIRYFDPPKTTGGIRGVSCTITLREAVEFTLEPKSEPWTRYHYAKEGDYYEMLAWQEYKAPLLGDVIRRLHPEKQVISEAEIIQLPSVGAIKRETITQKSIVFKNGYTTQDTPQRQLREEVFLRNDVNYVSAIIPEGL